MLLEYILDYRSSSLVYERIFLRTLKALELEGKLIRDKFILKLYVDADEVEKLEAFATLFS
ncbi:MAG TPA: hydrogenase, partial [Sulfurovum sp.]|nr:hydrogenase [Sulfurovum sp.]